MSYVGKKTESVINKTWSRLLENMNKIAKCFFGNLNEEKINISNKRLYKNMESEDNFFKKLMYPFIFKIWKV